MSGPPRLCFLPGATGDGDFWRPVADRIPGAWPWRLLNLPGAGEQPHDPRVASFADLVELVAAAIDERTDVVAQSMGGVVAIGLALRHPAKVRRLVLVATSGGIDVAGLGAAEWRDQYRDEFPNAAPWVWQDRPDFGDSISAVRAPTLLVWGNADPLSPVAVGERLCELLPASTLEVIEGGTHWLAHDDPDRIASLIAAHLRIRRSSGPEPFPRRTPR